MSYARGSMFVLERYEQRQCHDFVRWWSTDWLNRVTPQPPWRGRVKGLGLSSLVPIPRRWRIHHLGSTYISNILYIRLPCSGFPDGLRMSSNPPPLPLLRLIADWCSLAEAQQKTMGQHVDLECDPTICHCSGYTPATRTAGLRFSADAPKYGCYSDCLKEGFFIVCSMVQWYFLQRYEQSQYVFIRRWSADLPSRADMLGEERGESFGAILAGDDIAANGGYITTGLRTFQPFYTSDYHVLVLLTARGSRRHHHRFLFFAW